MNRILAAPEAKAVAVQLANELEAAKARVEDEVIATVRIATGLEGRLRQAKLDAELAQQQAHQAEQRADLVSCLHDAWTVVTPGGVI